MDANELVHCNQFALGLTVNDTNEIVVIVTMGEGEAPTHVVPIPVEQAFQVATSFAMLATEAAKLTAEIENAPDPNVAIELIRQRFSAGSN